MLAWSSIQQQQQQAKFIQYYNFVQVLTIKYPVNRPLVERGTREREKRKGRGIFSPNREPVHRLSTDLTMKP